MGKYIHKVNYYETDKMGITHHSNYVRWMEEARIDFLDKIGCGYKRMEDDGIISPVVSIKCEYKAPTTFDDKVETEVFIKEFKGVRLVLSYKMTNAESGETVLTAESSHCFLDKSGKPIILKKTFPEIDKKLRELSE